MELQATIHKSLRSEIERNIKENGYSLSKLGELTGINPGNLSDILNSNPPRAITIGQLDSLAATFGQAPGWLYELYPEECLAEGKISRPRLIPYLIRCAEVGRKDCLDTVVPHLLENPKNISILFSVAEQLYENGKHRESIPFYEYVIDSEKDSYSHPFIMSQYRLFRLTKGSNTEENWEAVIRFELYRKRLPENYQLDALLQLANVCYTLQRWRDVEKYADELRQLATIVYEDELRRRKRNITSEPLKTERHIVVYYGQGFLLKGIALTMQERYQEAKKYVQEYADLGWFEILDETGRQEIEKFRVWGAANLYALSIMMGNVRVLAEYVDFLETHPGEILSGLLTIMEAANKHCFAVDEILERFSEHLVYFNEGEDPVNLSRNFHFWEQKSEYNFRKGNISQAIDELLLCLDFSVKMENHSGFKKCVALFWKNLPYTSSQQRERYQAILERGDENNESSFSNHSFKLWSSL